MYLTFRDFVGFSAIALGVGLMILSYFMKNLESSRLGAFGSGLAAVGGGLVFVASGWA